MKKLKLNILGMHCASCAVNIEKALKKVKGVNEISVSALTNKAFITTDNSVKEEEMKKAVANIGYKVLSVETA